jgi:hypothetical protein
MSGHAGLDRCKHSHISKKFRTRFTHLLVILAVGQWFKWPLSLEPLGLLAAILIYTAATITLTWLASATSFRLIEQPYFDRKR